MSSLRPSIAAASDSIGVFPDVARREIPVIVARAAYRGADYARFVV
jgi:hypothetical protein